MDILLIIKVKILMFIKWSYRFPNYVDYRAYNGLHTLSKAYVTEI
jgi:hypothetical protein